MKIIDEIIFKNSFENLKEQFSIQTKTFVNQNLDSYNRVVFESIIRYLYPKFKIEKADLLNNIDIGISSFQFFNFSKRIDRNGGFFDNEIKFINPIKSNIDYLNYEERMKFNYEEMIRERTCIKEFYNNKDNIGIAKQLKDFTFFLPVTMSLEENKKGVKLGTIINAEGLIQFVKEIIEERYQDFNFVPEMSTKKIIRFCKPLTANFSFGIEYDFTDECKFLLKGQFEFPRFVKVFVIENSSIAKVKFSKNVMNLGIAYHPLFSASMVGIISYYSRLWRFKENEEFVPSVFDKIVYEIDKEINLDGTVTCHYPEEIGQRMKKYIFFYLSVMAECSKSYIDFLHSISEKSVISVS